MAKNNIFTEVPIKTPKTNHFDLSHDLKLSFNMGKIIPTTVLDCLPGDTFQIGFENLLRFAPLIAPVMHRIKVTTHYFFVPNRILWDNWEDWITGQKDVPPPHFMPKIIHPEDPGNTEVFGVLTGSLADYMGIPTSGYWYIDPETSYNYKINALPFAAYWNIYHEYYMDQNNDSNFDDFEELYKLKDGDNSENYGGLDFDTFDKAAGMKLGDRAWSHDYFTSALPWAQKGEDVYIPLSNMPVNPALNDEDIFYKYKPITANLRETGEPHTQGGSVGIFKSAQGAGVVSNSADIYFAGQYAANDAEFEGDGTIANLRRAFALQSWLEKNARGGTRYTEALLVHFGVRSSDARLQRPEYIGGSVQNMVISEVLATAETPDFNQLGEVTSPIGQMAGHGISVGASKTLKYRCEEHGWIIGLISVMPDTAYQNGLARKFSRPDRFDYFWPDFQHIGEQEIKQKELQMFYSFDEEIAEQTFGYIPRYSEYKFENSRVAGEFRDTLSFWHLGRIFPEDPNDPKAARLNESFIYPSRYRSVTEQSPFDRIFAVTASSSHTIYAHILNKIHARRPLARYGIPSI